MIISIFFSPFLEKFDLDENLTLHGLLLQISQKYNVPTEHLIMVKHKKNCDDVFSFDDFKTTPVKTLFPNVSSFDLYLKIILHLSRKKKGLYTCLVKKIPKYLVLKIS